ncbi:MAG: class I SAM-dependent methyltransferase [Bacteroidales bacterium]|nr:class I SAM-dependent methyltransferase [Bacteroidales bacterium]
MKELLFQSTSFAEYWWRASYKNGYGVHSPFLYKLIEDVFDDDRHFYAYDDIEAIRKDLLTWKQSIEFNEVGALSHWAKPNIERLISDITKCSSVSPKYGQLLFRLTNHFNPQTIVEFGTSVGISSMYMASGSPNAELYTYDFNEALVRIANSNFNSLNLRKAKAEVGLFEEKLTKMPKIVDKIDFLLLDGNHRKEPTILYYEFLKSQFHNDTIVILDDIHWSQGMEEAWDIIKADKAVSLSIDLFQFGILFFKKEFLGNKQHFVVKF